MSIGDVCIVYDLACSYCGNLDAAQLSKSLGLVFCNDTCYEAGLDEELRDKPLLSDAVQRFWSEEEQCYVIAASFSKYKRKVKQKATSAKNKASAAKRKAKLKAERAKSAASRKNAQARAQARRAKSKGQQRAKSARSKVKKGAGKAKQKVTGGPSRSDSGAEPLPTDVPEPVAEVFSLQYLLGKHNVDMDELDAEELYELRPHIEAGEFGSFLLDFAISTLSDEQGYPEIAQSIIPELAQRHAQLLQTEVKLFKIELAEVDVESLAQPSSILIAGGSTNGKSRAHWLDRLNAHLTTYFQQLAMYWIAAKTFKLKGEKRELEASLYGSYRTLLLTLGIVQGVYDETGLMDRLAEPLEALERRIRLEASARGRNPPSPAAQTKAKAIAAILVNTAPPGTLSAGQSPGYDIERALLMMLDLVVQGGRPQSPAPQEIGNAIRQLAHQIAAQLFEAFWPGS